MRRVRRSLTIRVALCTVALTLGAASLGTGVQTNDLTDDPIGQRLERWRGVVQDWRSQARLCVALTLLVGLAGLVISGLEKYAKRPKIWVVALGIGVSALTLINTTLFPADFRAYGRLASLGELKLGEVEDRIYHYGDDEERRLAAEEIDQRFRDLEALHQKFILEGTVAELPVGASGLAILPTVRAQALRKEQPDWLTGKAADETTIYFVGAAASPSLFRAKEGSVNKARQALADSWREVVPAGVGIDATQLGTFVGRRSRVLETYFLFDDASGLYQYYALVGLPRAGLYESVSLYVWGEGLKVPEGRLAELARRAEEILPDLALSAARRQERDVRALASSLTTVDPATAEQFDRAQQLAASGESKLAASQLSGITGEHPEFYEAWKELGGSLSEAGRLVEADEAYARAVQLEPGRGDADLYFRYGLLFSEMGNTERARRMLRKALEVDPRFPGAREALETIEAGSAGP